MKTKKYLMLLTIAICVVLASTMAHGQGKELSKKQESLKEINKDLHAEKEDIKAYNKIVEKIANKEIECGEYDYKGDTESRVHTIKVAIEDMQLAIENGTMPKHKMSDAKTRIKKLTSVVNKYQKLLSEAEKKDMFDYKGLNEQFSDEIDVVYSELNK